MKTKKITVAQIAFLERLARSLLHKNGGKYEDAWTMDGEKLKNLCFDLRKQ